MAGFEENPFAGDSENPFAVSIPSVNKIILLHNARQTHIQTTVVISEILCWFF